MKFLKLLKKDASTSCFDLIDDSNSYNQVLVENIVVETCSDEVAKENEQLKQEVARLGPIASSWQMNKNAYSYPH